MTLTIPGSGSPEAYIRRASTGLLLEIGEDKILLDCGGGVFDNLVRSGRLPRDITHLFFTNAHPAIAEFTPTPADIARAAQLANVKRLLITHFRIHMDSKEGHDSAKQDLAEHFSGMAAIAEDLDVYQI